MRKQNPVYRKAFVITAALSLTLLLSGCVTSNKNSVLLAPHLPPLPSNLDLECSDPGVPKVATVSDAVGVIGDTRLYALCNRLKHQNTKKFYNDVRLRFQTK